MAKILKENNENIYAKTITEVENFLDAKNVSFTVIASDLVEVKILDKTFELRKAGISFPRMTDEEKLYIPE